MQVCADSRGHSGEQLKLNFLPEFELSLFSRSPWLYAHGACNDELWVAAVVAI